MAILLSLMISLIYSLYGYQMGLILLNTKKKTTTSVVLNILIFVFIYHIITFLIDSTFSIFLTTLLFIPLLKGIFNKEILDVVIVSIIIELFNSIIKLIIFEFADKPYLESICMFNNYNILKFIISLISILIASLFIIKFKEKLIKIINKISQNKYKYLIISIMVYINIVMNYNMRYKDILINSDTLFDIFLITILVGTIMYIIDSTSRIKNLNKYYQEIFEYSKLSEELNVKYRMRLHENKNQLLLIESMIDNKNYNLESYIDYLLDLDKSSINNRYLSELVNLPIPGIKRFINYKLMELNKIDTKIEVFVSEDLKNVDISNIKDKDYNDISTILGVILDNIIDAVKLQKEKLVSINIFVEDNYICMQFANNFVGKIDIDKIYKKGFSTKGKERGVGLALVSDIISHSEVIDCKPSIIDNFFMQDVKIKLPKTIK